MSKISEMIQQAENELREVVDKGTQLNQQMQQLQMEGQALNQKHQEISLRIQVLKEVEAEGASLFHDGAAVEASAEQTTPAEATEAADEAPAEEDMTEPGPSEA